jgi:hypothetical protein
MAKFKVGDRVMNLVGTDTINSGATGTVFAVGSKCSFVDWDLPQAKGEKRWLQEDVRLLRLHDVNPAPQEEWEIPPGLDEDFYKKHIAQGRAIFPVHLPQRTVSRRDQFAMAAMQGPLANYSATKIIELVDSLILELDNVPKECEPEPDPQPEVKPDYSHLIGKWVKMICESSPTVYTPNKWYKVFPDDNVKTGIKIQDNLGANSFCATINKNDYHGFVKKFDLSNPKDHNPDEQERIIPFDIDRWRKGDYVRVQTRDGRHISEIVLLNSINRPLVGVIKGDGSPVSWHVSGHIYSSCEDRHEDLTLVVKGGEK